VLLINISDELTFRDFKKADSCARVLEIPVNFLQNDGKELGLPDGITFLTFDTFKFLSKKEASIDPEKTLLIIDEVDSLLFQPPSTTLKGSNESSSNSANSSG